jgi:hypothetical protein
MKRFIPIALFAGLALFATPERAEAQACTGTSVTQNCTWTATVSVMATLSCTVTQHFNFGSWPSSVGSVAANETNSGRLRCTTDPGNHLNISFALASSLSDGLGHTVPIIYGNESARAYDCDGSCGPVFGFNPSVGTTGFLVNTGVLTLTLGENGPNQEAAEVKVNLLGAAAGTYSGTIVATVILQ